jgi:hypothetical protein
MWWKLFRKEDTEKQKERDQLEMDLATAQFENPYVKALQDLKNAEELRRLEYAQRELRVSMIANAVDAAQRCGLIDNDELAKYSLDESGTYIPKLKNNEP